MVPNVIHNFNNFFNTLLASMSTAQKYGHATDKISTILLTLVKYILFIPS